MEVAGVHVEQDSNIPVVLLRELAAPHRVLPIHIGGPEAAAIAMALTGHVPPRPLAHDVMAELVGRLHAKVDAAEVLAVHNGTFIAQLILSGPHGHEHLDSRASDAIALAMRVGAPVLVAESVLVAVGAIPEPFSLDFDTLDDDLDHDLDDDPSADAGRPSSAPVDGSDDADDTADGADLGPAARLAAARARERRRLQERLDRHRREREQLEQEIDEEVDRFRSFLDELEPADFTDTSD